MSWQKQADKPLFPDLIWSRPENKRYAGKLLIIGGQSGEFVHVAAAFEAADRAGAGYIRVILPESLRKLAQVIPEVEFAPANQSGSFARTALAQWFDLADWADGVILAGDFGKNSETTTIIDGFLLRGNCPAVLGLSSISSIGIRLEQLVNMPLTLVINRAFLQKIGTALGLLTPLQSTTPIDGLAEIMQEISRDNKANLVVQDESIVWTAANGNIVSTKSRRTDNTKLSAACAVWQMQNPTKPLEALATACFEAASS